MSLKNTLRNSEIIYRAVARGKASLQEYRAYSDQKKYGFLAWLKNNGWVLTSGPQRPVRKPLHEKPRGALRIFLLFPMNNWEAVLPRALEPFGEVVPFSWEGGKTFSDKESWRKNREELNIEILKRFHAEHARSPFDAVVGYVSDYDLLPETLRTIGKAGPIIFNMCWDDKLYFKSRLRGQHLGVAEVAPEIDLSLTNAPDSIVKYRAVGGCARFWPEAAHPEIHKPYPLPLEFDVTFVGQKYGWRPRFIENLRKNGIRVACFGKGWSRGPLSDEEMVQLYSRSKINLGFSGVGHSKKLMCLKGRDFEVPMSGGLYLTQDNPELSLVYRIGEEIVTFRNEADCVQKIQWLLANPDVASNIRSAGYLRAQRDHTWARRFSEIFVSTGLMESTEG